MSDRLVPVRRQVVESIIQQASGFDPDVLVVMERRDNTLIEQEILHGAASRKYVYSFKIGRTLVTGISVIGARELAYAYGGMQHEIMATTSKVDDLLVITQYPYGDVRYDVRFQRVPELASFPDFYECAVRIKDIKTGNTTMARKREYRQEERSAETLRANPGLTQFFDRPHYDTIAESKAYRNGMLNLIPQDVQLKWKENMLALGNDDSIAASIIDEKRASVLRYAAAKAIGVDREAIEALTLEQISGLGDAIREGKAEQFAAAVEAMGLRTDVDDRPRRAASKSADAGRLTMPTVAEYEAQRAWVQKLKSDKADLGSGTPTPTPTTTRQPGQESEKKPAPAREDEQPKQTAGQTETPPPPKEDTEKQQPDGNGFDVYALDEFSDVVQDNDGSDLHFSKPTEFAVWFVERYKTADPTKRAALVEANADSINEASASPSAKAMLDAVLYPPDQEVKPEQPPPEQKQQGPAPVPTEQLPNKRVNWAKYGQAVDADLKTVKTVEDLVAWEARNKPTYAGKAYEVKIETMIGAARARIGAGTEKVSDADMDRANDLIPKLIAVTTQAQLDAVLPDAVKAWGSRIERERPDIAAKLTQVWVAASARARMSKNTPGAEPAPSGDPSDYDPYAGQPSS